MDISKVTIGADPEGFFVDKASGKSVSAHDLLPGTKENPQPVDKGAVQVDGMAWEFNITPAATEDEFVENIQFVMNTIKEMVPHCYLSDDVVCKFSPEVWNSTPEEALELGCEPDYNAYTGEQNPQPNQEEQFRSASGHIHIGWAEGMDVNDPGHFDACCMLTKQLDSLLGVASLPLENVEQGPVRRKLYGKAGAFRPKSYGMEYRVLSNFWLKDEETIRWVYRQVLRAISELLEGIPLYKDKTNTIQQFIDGCNETEVTRVYSLLRGVNVPVQMPESFTKEIEGKLEEGENLKWISEEAYTRICDKDNLWKKFLVDHYQFTYDYIESVLEKYGDLATYVKGGEVADVQG